jgi:hypothetical protein
MTIDIPKRMRGCSTKQSLKTKTSSPLKDMRHPQQSAVPNVQLVGNLCEYFPYHVAVTVSK